MQNKPQNLSQNMQVIDNNGVVNDSVETKELEEYYQNEETKTTTTIEEVLADMVERVIDKVIDAIDQVVEVATEEVKKQYSQSQHLENAIDMSQPEQQIKSQQVKPQQVGPQQVKSQQAPTQQVKTQQVKPQQTTQTDENVIEFDDFVTVDEDEKTDEEEFEDEDLFEDEIIEEEDEVEKEEEEEEDEEIEEEEEEETEEEEDEEEEDEEDNKKATQSIISELKKIKEKLRTIKAFESKYKALPIEVKARKEKLVKRYKNLLSVLESKIKKRKKVSQKSVNILNREKILKKKSNAKPKWKTLLDYLDK